MQKFFQESECLLVLFVEQANKQTSCQTKKPTCLSPPPAPCPSCDWSFAVLFPSGVQQHVLQHVLAQHVLN